MNKQKVAIVTGGGRGIGFGIAAQLAQDGYALAIFGSSAPDKVVEAMGKLEEFGHLVEYFQCNLGNMDDIDKAVQSVLNKFGRIDVLVNNAGVGPKVRLDILETTEESYDFVMNINLKGTFFLTQKVANQMIKQQGAGITSEAFIINIGSMSAYTSSTSRGEYCMAKAGVGMLTTLFADRLADQGIFVYEIRPGIIQTDMTKVVSTKYDKLISEGITPIKRWGQPEDIANVVSVLCQGKFRFSTGEVINVDGGFHMRRL